LDPVPHFEAELRHTFPAVRAVVREDGILHRATRALRSPGASFFVISGKRPGRRIHRATVAQGLIDERGMLAAANELSSSLF
jgi:hypothetical protein